MTHRDDDISSAANAFCTCGGSGPDEPDCCAACALYHAARTARDERDEARAQRDEAIEALRAETDCYPERCESCCSVIINGGYCPPGLVLRAADERRER